VLADRSTGATYVAGNNVYELESDPPPRNVPISRWAILLMLAGLTGTAILVVRRRGRAQDATG